MDRFGALAVLIYFACCISLYMLNVYLGKAVEGGVLQGPNHLEHHKLHLNKTKLSNEFSKKF